MTRLYWFHKKGEEIRVKKWRFCSIDSTQQRDQEGLPELLLFDDVTLSSILIQNEQMISQFLVFLKLIQVLGEIHGKDRSALFLWLSPVAQLKTAKYFLSVCWPSSLRAPWRGALPSVCPILGLAFFWLSWNLWIMSAYAAERNLSSSQL